MWSTSEENKSHQKLALLHTPSMRSNRLNNIAIIILECVNKWLYYIRVHEHEHEHEPVPNMPRNRKRNAQSIYLYYHPLFFPCFSLYHVYSEFFRSNFSCRSAFLQTFYLSIFCSSISLIWAGKKRSVGTDTSVLLHICVGKKPNSLEN